MELMQHQIQALKDMHDGCVLYGGVGSGKTVTALSYYIENHKEKDVYVITTAKKRDSLDWEGEAARLGLGTEDGASLYGKLTVDSWNNVSRYVGPEYRDAFFIFDEQRVVGSGVWVKSFIRIARLNQWILLSATPGDTWMDYAPIFIANGYFKNITEFKMDHVVYAPYVKFPKIVRYLGVQKLEKLRNHVLVEMPYEKHTRRHLNWIDVAWDKEKTRKAITSRWNPFTDSPMVDISELFRVLRRISNSDPSRMETLRELLKTHDRLIVFYNFNYELDILRTLADDGITVAEWNGKKKQPVPETDKWVYLVQYVAGAEGWNCVATNAMAMYSLTYSYKNFEQAQGRIDRLNTKFVDLYYYVLCSHSQIDLSIKRNLATKKSFSERKEAAKMGIWG